MVVLTDCSHVQMGLVTVILREGGHAQVAEY